MASGNVEFNPAFFDQVLNSPQVEAMCRARAERILAAAVASAPVGPTGKYSSSFSIEIVKRKKRRTVVYVRNRDPKALIVESRTATLARAGRAR